MIQRILIFCIKRICAKFEEISNALLLIPSNVTEMVNLQNCIDQVKNVEMKTLEELVEESKRRLAFMLSYSDLKKEDFDLNAVVFTWLTKIGPTFIESENNLLKSSSYLFLVIKVFLLIHCFFLSCPIILTGILTF